MDESPTESFAQGTFKGGTEVGLAYIQERLRLLEFSRYHHRGAVVMLQHAPEVIADLHERAKASSAAVYMVEKYADNPIAFVSATPTAPFLSELLLCRTVDNFIIYLSELLTLIFKTRPETLRTNEQIPVDFVLQFPNMDNFVSALAERKIDNLSREGTKKVLSYFTTRLGFAVFEESQDTALASESIELRHLIVHKRGIVDATFKKRLPNYPLEVGQRLNLDIDIVEQTNDALDNLVRKIDARAAQKFNLPWFGGDAS